MAITLRLGMISLLAASFCACSPQNVPVEKAELAEKQAPFALALSDLDDGTWRLDIDLSEPQSALMFSRSKDDYRQNTYTALSDGVTLERIDGFDTLLIEPGVQKASFQFTPYTGTLPGTYTPFIPFTDGGKAVYLGAFELLRAESRDTVKDLNGGLDNWNGEQFDIPVHLETRDTILLDGKIHAGAATTTINGNGSYAYLGPTTPVEGKSFSGILDPGLPAWLVDDFDDTLAKIFMALEEGFGRPLEDKASILFAFRGYETEGFSNTGGVLPGGLMVLETSGDAMRDPNERLRGYLQWFLTHEGTHMFQHPGGVTYADRKDSWILEGGANAITQYLLDELDTIPDEVVQSRYKNGFDYCVSSIENASMVELIQRNDQSHYDCGDLVFRISEAALPDHDLFDLWAAILDNLSDDKSYDTETYFSALRALGVDETLVTQLESFVEGPVEQPLEDLKLMMAQAGITAVIEDGALQSIEFPK